MKIEPSSEGKNNFLKESEIDIFTPISPIYSFDDIILPAYTKDEIFSVIDYVNNSDLVFNEWGLEKTHKHSKRLGINLYGESGMGKTMAAHAIANYLNRKLIIVNYADIESKYVGDTPKNIKKAFQAAEKTNSILFFDEADAILSRRVTDMKSAGDVNVNQTRSVLLMLLNDFQDYIIFATNFIENFDPAFMRRILCHIHFTLPDYETRVKLWKMYIPKSMPNNIDIEELASKYDGISGSDISNAILSAAFFAARQNQKKKIVDKTYVFNAIENIIESKKANNKNKETQIRHVSEEYVKSVLEERK